jgi:hypothetical protein
VGGSNNLISAKIEAGNSFEQSGQEKAKKVADDSPWTGATAALQKSRCV